MTKTKSTKRALLMSALSLLMCVSMLIGSTFAWFTDSVTSSGNKIQSGTLKLDLELLDKETKVWTSIKEDKTALFDYDLWEPGYTEVKMLKVENEGTLALKWYAKFVSDAKLGILADVIDVYVNPYGILADTSGVTYPAGRVDLTEENGWVKKGTVKDFVNTIEETTYGSLKAGESAYLGIALKMQESAGNIYQDKTLGEFDIMILATQETYEKDSFDDQYDIEATYTLKVDDATALQSSFEDVNKPIVLDATGVEFDVSTLGTADESMIKTVVIPDGVTVQGAEFNFAGMTAIEPDSTNTLTGEVAFDDCTFAVSSSGTGIDMGMLGDASTIEAGTTKLVFNNCTFAGLIVITGVEAEYNNCTFEASSNVAGSVAGINATATFNNCSFNYSNTGNVLDADSSVNVQAASVATLNFNACELNNVSFGKGDGGYIYVDGVAK